MTKRHTEMNADDRVLDYPDRQSGISWPLPVDARLEEMLNTLRDVGERTSRREIAAAIIAMTPDVDAESLSKLLRSYRTATVGRVLGVSGSERSNVIPFEQHGPGPRRRGS
jgi:hypothetical protein